MNAQISAIETPIRLPLSYFTKRKEIIFEDIHAYYSQVVRILFTVHIGEDDAKEYSNTVMEQCLLYKSFNNLQDFEKYFFTMLRERYKLIQGKMSRVDSFEIMQEHLRNIRENPDANDYCMMDESGMQFSKKFERIFMASTEIQELHKVLLVLNKQDLATDLLLIILIAQRFRIGVLNSPMIN